MAFNSYSSIARGSRGRGRARGRGFQTRSLEPDPIPTDLGKVITSIKSVDLRPVVSETTRIQDAEVVASFNWMGNVDHSTITIPGVPPRWSPPRGTTQLSEDSDTYYRDINAAYSPEYPLHPTALSILSNSAVDTSSIDLMACASTLRSLLIFTLGERQTFRITVQEIGNTIFFIRRVGTPRELIPGVRGYGHTFPEAFTDWHETVKGSSSNQRVIQYHFAGMKCLVRYESDGYLPEKLPNAPDLVSGGKQSSLGGVKKGNSGNGLDLDTALHDLNVSLHVPDSTGGNDIKVTPGGIEVPQSATFELKTRSNRRKDEDFFSEFAPRLWLTQTPYFVVAFHNLGKFDCKDIHIQDVGEKIDLWEAQHHMELRRLAGLLEWIVKRARDAPNRTIELWRHESGDLDVRSVSVGFVGALPGAVEDKWKGRVERGTGVAPLRGSRDNDGEGNLGH